MPTADRLMIHRCDIILQTAGAPDSEGGPTYTESTVRSSVPCNVQMQRAGQIGTFDQRGQERSGKVYFNGNPGVDPRHVLVFGGRRLRVRSVVNECELSRVWTVMVIEDKQTRF